MERPEYGEAYFQFPLFMVTKAPDKDIHQRMRDDASDFAIIAYSRNLTGNATIGAEKYYKDNGGLPEGVSIQRIAHDGRQYLAGAWSLHVYFGRPNEHGAMCRAQAAQEKYEKHGHEGWRVRLRADLFWDAIKHEWKPIKIRVLCSIYAIIGSDKHKRISHGLIRALASGYKGPKEARAAEARRAELVASGTESNRGPKAELIPETTIRYWIQHLHERGLFRTCMHQGHRYYATSGFETDKDFAKFILQRYPPKVAKKLVDTSDLQT